MKQHLVRLLAFCGCVVAYTGSSCGITYLMGGSYEQITYATKNMIANITGMICDGAKPSCSLKISSSVPTALLSALMAIETKLEAGKRELWMMMWIRRNMSEIGKTEMLETDKVMLGILTNKKKEEISNEIEASLLLTPYHFLPTFIINKIKYIETYQRNRT